MNRLRIYLLNMRLDLDLEPPLVLRFLDAGVSRASDDARFLLSDATATGADTGAADALDDLTLALAFAGISTASDARLLLLDAATGAATGAATDAVDALADALALVPLSAAAFAFASAAAAFACASASAAAAFACASAAAVSNLDNTGSLFTSCAKIDGVLLGSLNLQKGLAHNGSLWVGVHLHGLTNRLMTLGLETGEGSCNNLSKTVCLIAGINPTPKMLGPGPGCIALWNPSMQANIVCRSTVQCSNH